MIEKLEISACASYGAAVEKMDQLGQVNFVYGSNGVGKTTVSRLIADSSLSPKSSIYWQNGTELETFVYNRDFVCKNFNQSNDLKGIFTLGQNNIEVREEIEKARSESERLTQDIENMTITLKGPDEKGGKQGELEQVETEFRDTCWEIMKKHDKELQEALKGFRKEKQKFKDNLIAECEKQAPVLLPTQADLERRAATLFGTMPTTEPLFSTISDMQFLASEMNPILAKRVIGKIDVDIAAMILRLNNSDWVKHGIQYFDNNNGDCPFCQQKASLSLAAEFEKFFDETFIQDTSAISNLKDSYCLEGDQISQAIGTVLEVASRFLDNETLREKKQLFDAGFKTNQQLLALKLKEPSQSITLEPLKDILHDVKTLLEAANSLIQKHNALVVNHEFEKKQLIADVWVFLAHVEAAKEFNKYQKKKKDVNSAVISIRQKIEKATSDRELKDTERRNLEKQSTSIQPAVDSINKLLKDFGFGGFSLEATNNNLYRLRRPDGSDAKETLSEGERSFITFLYFYHLLKGSASESNVITNRVAVFDDPVSSLDSDVLFVVGSLIRQIIEDVRANRGHIKQVFVLTHNPYFHKEITFHKDRSAGRAFKEETFWVIRKPNGRSTLQKHEFNPIKTSYDLLWSEVRADSPQAPGVQNAMRRILEHYFRILGGLKYDEILNLFDGEEKNICRALFSWVNDGSHSVPDDVFMTVDDSTVEKQREVFRKIFIKTNQISHYNMMMGVPYLLESATSFSASNGVVQN